MTTPSSLRYPAPPAPASTTTAVPRGASRVALGLALAALLCVAACSSTKAPTAVKERPGPALSGERDGPEAIPPVDLARVPDAVPQVEPIRAGGPNKPYEVLGRDYTPRRDDSPLTERGLASWYGKKFHGRRTASGEVYNMYAMSAAHKTMPIPSYARVRNPKNGREVIVRVNDRGPFHAGRVIDLSYTAAFKLGVLNSVAPVEVERITHEQIRTGAWRRERNAEPVAAAPSLSPSSSPSPLAVAALTAAASITAPQGAAPAEPGTEAPLPATRPWLATQAAPALGASAEVAAGPADGGREAADALGTGIEAPRPAAQAPPRASRAHTTAARGFWVQLGAFKQRDGAEHFQRRVADEADWLAPLLAVFAEPTVFRLQAGPYPNRAEAQSTAERIRERLQLVPVVVERR